MKIATYIESMLVALSTKFPTALIHYAFSKSGKMHIVDLRGESIEALSADDWVNVYNDLVDGFESKFDDDSLLFVREGSLVRINSKKADKIIHPQFVPFSPTGEASPYSWIDKPVRYVYESLTKPSDKRKRKVLARRGIAQTNESTYNTIESVLTLVGTDSFCGV